MDVVLSAGGLPAASEKHWLYRLKRSLATTEHERESNLQPFWGQEPFEQTSALWSLYLLLEDSSIDSKALRLVFKSLTALALQHLSDLLSAYEPLGLSGHLTQACFRIKVKCGEASFTFNAAVSGAAARWPQMCPSVDLI